MKADLLRKADALVALTAFEARLLERLAGPKCTEVVIVGNGVEPIPLAPERPAGLPDPYVVLLGTVSRRKRQLDTVERLAGSRFVPVAVGGIEGDHGFRANWDAALARGGGRWLGEVADQASIRRILHDAHALIHLSDAEGQSLAVLEAMACGTPVVASRLPANEELASRYPRHVRVVDGLQELPGVLESVQAAPGPAPIPSWDDVAGRLAEVYRSVLTASRGGS
jgi:glycosyltransferase involved in cell wall biosynthesis